ncbi:BREX system P-loop protein BrxC [Leucobacter insecticola]|uniref:BREX system P-loop protein BrxC n=1 Tax=Leucobacter insecticola TaxID=2714934 RepID=A0A6G8FLB0_9MICO|nr:BREX system P-loop protein BrxC [Leucobacter insecticola]
MTINEIFAKDVQRQIEGVIKADDSSRLGVEVDEYVLTNEAAKGLEHTLEAYTASAGGPVANGVWISGFFGSGKSHLLKMLAHLLGDVDGHDYTRSEASASFRNKAEGAFLPALIAKADAIPAKSLLFNIDQKATLITKDQTDALLRVFVKVFDESRGYYGNQGHIARFERDLDSRGQLAAFVAAFERRASMPWSQGREQSALEAANIDEAFAEVNGSSSPGIIRQYNSSYHVSIEDFADEVAAWLAQQPEGFRLNFFVDEVGQFIGTNTQLMLNLQTIAESLATKCDGRAWIFVTSQEDMEKVGGDRTKTQANDFSKIQARFKNRLKLTSQDVEEVIRKRLLTKSAAATPQIAELYAAEHANFKTVFDFVDGTSYPSYRGEEHFIGTYPFVSYQFPLFQAAIEGISEHNLFEGRNSSVGERSMLGVVQEAAKHLADQPLGALAPFDQMFEGIRSALKAATHRAILDAENLAKDGRLSELALRLLKALFLVKYVERFKATPRNLTVLVYDRFGADLTQLGKEVREALTELEAQTFVQRMGDTFQYLSNEEQRIEQAIKSVDIDSSEVSKRLFSMLSDSVVKTPKVTHAKNGQIFPFGYKLDGAAMSRQQELALHFMSPDTDLSLEQIKGHSAGLAELRVVIPSDSQGILNDLALFIKTDKYLRQESLSSQAENAQLILGVKRTQNNEREKELIERLRVAVGRATLVHNATVLDVAATEPMTRIVEGFQRVIAATYTNLGMLGNAKLGEQKIATLAMPPEDGLLDEDVSMLAVPADDVLAHLVMRSKQHEQVTLRQLIDRYTAKPYGWDQWAIVCVVAYLAGVSKVQIAQDSTVLKRSELARSLRDTSKFDRLIVAPQRVYDQRVITAFRKFVVEFTDDGVISKDPLELAREGKQRLEDRLRDLQRLCDSRRYPFLMQLTEPLEMLAGLCDHPAEWFVTDFAGDVVASADELLEAKDHVIDPIRAFVNGPQREIFDSAKQFLQQHDSNLSYLAGGAADLAMSLLDDPQVFRGTGVNRLQGAISELAEQLDVAIEEARDVALADIESRWDRIVETPLYAEATAATREAVADRVHAVQDRVQAEIRISDIQVLARQFSENIFPELHDELVRAAKERTRAAIAAQTESDSAGNDRTVDAANRTAPETISPVKQTVSIARLDLPGRGEVLATVDDVERYLGRLRETLLAAIQNDQNISL